MGAETTTVAAAKSAKQLAVEAEQAAKLAKLQAENAAIAAKAAASELRADALKSRKDTCPKGSVDLMPELRIADSDLAAKVASGDLDGVLSELLEMLTAHPRLAPDGSFKERGVAIEAVKSRLKKA
jgi:hypothetical protein